MPETTTIPPAVSPEEAAMRAIRGSAAWKFLSDCLLSRRTNLLQHGPHELGLTADAQLGALFELQRLIDGPDTFITAARATRAGVEVEREKRGEAIQQARDWWVDPGILTE